MPDTAKRGLADVHLIQTKWLMKRIADCSDNGGSDNQLIFT